MDRKWAVVVEPCKQSLFEAAIRYHGGQVLDVYDAHDWLEYEVMLPDDVDRSLLTRGTGAKLHSPRSYTAVGLGLIGHAAFYRLRQRVTSNPSLSAKFKARVEYFQQAETIWDRRARLAVDRNEAISTFDAFRSEKKVNFREKEIAIKFYVCLAMRS